jgi:hypothetical protein
MFCQIINIFFFPSAMKEGQAKEEAEKLRG